MKAGIYTWYLTEGVLPQARSSPTVADRGCTLSSGSRPWAHERASRPINLVLVINDDMIIATNICVAEAIFKLVQ